MSTITDRLTAVVDALTAAGVPATLDARDLNPPGAWVTLQDVQTPTLCGGYDVRAAVCLIAGDAGSSRSLDVLGDMLDTVADVLTFDEPVRPMSVQPPGVGAPIPALVVITTT